MRKITRLPATFLYLLAASGLGLYLFGSLHPRMMMSPIARLILLGFICLTAYFGSLLFAKTTGTSTARKIMKTTFGVFFGLYLFLLITLVLFDSYFGRTGFSFFARWDDGVFPYYLQNSFNIIPFKTVFDFLSGLRNGAVSPTTAVTNLLGNLVAFAPFAFFLPLLFPKMRSFRRFLLTMLGVVILVEIAQLLLLTGSCDIDDVILNVGGACGAYGLLRIGRVQKITAKITTL